MSTSTQSEIADLLEQLGARPRSNRHDCPKCDGLRTITRTDETFFCHKCHWKGNAITLQKELGTFRRIPWAEYRERSRKRERAQDAARRLYAAAHKRQLELREKLRELGRVEVAAHDTGPTEEAWEILSTVYANRPTIEQELDALESADPVIVLASLRQLAQKSSLNFASEWLRLKRWQPAPATHLRNRHRPNTRARRLDGGA